MPDWHPVDLLPGLWVGLLAWLLLAALRRWYDRVPWTVASAFGLALLILFGPVLFGGKLLLPLDSLRGHPPFQGLPPMDPHGNFLQGDLIELVGPSVASVREAWAAGRWPLWNARVGAGMPLLADPQAQAFQPLIVLATPLPWMRAAGVTAALRVFTALVFAFLWMRRQGLSTGSSLAGAFAYGLGGFVLLWVGWPIANSAAFLPLVLYALARCRQLGGRRDFVLLALGSFSLLASGHPETTVYAFGLALAFAASQAFDGTDGTSAAVRRRRLLAAVAAMGIAGLTAAPLLLPTVELLPKTLRVSLLRVAGVGLEGWKLPESGDELARRWLPLAAPNAYGNSRYVDYWGLTNTNEDASGFVGTATLLAALLALGIRKGQRRFPQERLALAAVAICLLLLAVLPTVGSIYGSRRLLLPLSLCLAYVGACTLERFRTGEARRWPVLAAAAGLGLVIAWGYVAHPHPTNPELLAILRFGWLRWQGRFLVLTVLLLVATRGRRWMPPAVAGLIAAELLLLHLPANPPMPQHLALPATPAIRFLQDNLKRTRMAALGRDFPPNVPSLYGLADVRIFNPMAPRAYVDHISPVIAAWWSEIPELGVPTHPLYPRLGVRSLLTAPGRELPAPLKRVFAGEDAWIWQVPGPFPRVYLYPQGRVRIQRLEAQWVQAQSPTGGEAMLASSIFQDGGWRALVDGRSVPAGMLDGPFVAVPLPAGEHRIDLLYRPRSFLWGCILAALGLAAGAVWWIPTPTNAFSSGSGPPGRDPDT